MVLDLVKPQIDANNKRYENGQKGGRPKKSGTEKTNGFKNEKPNVNENENENVNVNDKEREAPSELQERKGQAFSPPTLEEVAEYVKERGNKIDPQRFVDFYTAKGWMIGKNKMKDWKAAARSWERQNEKTAADRVVNTVRKNRFTNFPQRNWDFDEMEKMEQERRDKAREQSDFNGQAYQRAGD